MTPRWPQAMRVPRGGGWVRPERQLQVLKTRGDIVGHIAKRDNLLTEISKRVTYLCWAPWCLAPMEMVVALVSAKEEPNVTNANYSCFSGLHATHPNFLPIVLLFLSKQEYVNFEKHGFMIERPT